MKDLLRCDKPPNASSANAVPSSVDPFECPSLWWYPFRGTADSKNCFFAIMSCLRGCSLFRASNGDSIWLKSNIIKIIEIIDKNLLSYALDDYLCIICTETSITWFLRKEFFIRKYGKQMNWLIIDCSLVCMSPNCKWRTESNYSIGNHHELPLWFPMLTKCLIVWHCFPSRISK